MRTITTPKVFAGSPPRLALPFFLCVLGLPLISPQAFAKPTHQKTRASHAAAPNQGAPVDPAARIALERARQLAAQGADQLAETELRHAISLAPSWLEPQRELAQWYAKHGRWAEAADTWRGVLYLNRNDQKALQSLEEARRHLPFPDNQRDVVSLGQSSENRIVGTRATAEKHPRLAQGATAPSSAPTTNTGGTSASSATNGGTTDATNGSATNGGATTAGATTAGATPTAGASANGSTQGQTPSSTKTNTSKSGSKSSATSTKTGTKGGAKAAGGKASASTSKATAKVSGAKTTKTEASKGVAKAAAPSGTKHQAKAIATTPVVAKSIKPVSKKRQAAAWPHVENATRLFKSKHYTAALDAYQRANSLDPNNPYAQMGIADTLLVLNRFKPAEQAYRNVLAVRPTEVKALRGLGDSLIAQKRFDEAIPVYKQVAARNSGDTKEVKFQDLYHLAQLLTWTKQYPAADPYYRQALALEPKRADVWTAWGEAQAYSNNDRASDTFRHALVLVKPTDPLYARAALGLANFYNWKGVYDKAIPQYQGVLKQQPNNLAALTGLGDALTYSSQPEFAVPYYERAVSVDANSQAAQLGLGRALVLGRRYQEGIPYVNRVLDKDPNNREALRMLALAQSSLSASGTTEATAPALEAYQKLLTGATAPNEQAEIWAAIADLKSRQGDPAGTLEAYNKALQLAPDNSSIGLNYAQQLITQDQLDTAEPVVRDIVTRDPNNVRARILQVVVESRQGHKERAQALMKNLEGMEITNPLDAIQLANALRNADDPDAAKRVLTRLEGQLPEDNATAVQVANAVRDAGELDAATGLYQQILQRDPNNLDAHVNLGEVLVWQRQYDAAQKQIDAVLAKDPNNVQAKVLAGKIALSDKTENGLNTASGLANQAVAANPNSGPAQALLGTVLSIQGKFADAVAKYRRALEINPNDLDARVGLARNLYYSKEVPESISEYQKLIQMAPNDNQVKLELAKIYLDTNRLTDAEVLFNQVLQSRRSALLPGAELPGITGQVEMRSNARVSPLMMQAFVAPLRGGRTFHTRVYLIQAQAPSSAPTTQTGGTSANGGTPNTAANGTTTNGAADATGSTANTGNGAAGGGAGTAGATTDNTGTAGAAVPGTGAAAPGTAAAAPGTAGTDAAAAAAAAVPAPVAPVSGPDPALAEQVAALRGLGEVRRLQQRYPEAIDYFRQALKIDDTDTGARVGLAQSLRAQGDYVTSLSEIERVLATDEKNLQARVLHAQLMGDTGKPDQAQQELDTLVTQLQETTPVETYLTLAQSFNSLRNYDASLQLLDVASKTYPNEPTVPRLRAETLTFAKRWEDALTEYNNILALPGGDKDADALLGKARVYNYSNRLEQAEPLYRQVLQLSPDNYPALTELADVLSRRSNWVDSIALYRQAVQKNPNDLGVRVELARTLRYDRQFDEAENELNQVIGKDAKYAPAYTERGILRGQQGRYDPAITDLRQALSITPTDLNAQFGLAEVLGYAKNYDESISLYRTALERDPTNEKGRTELGLMLSYAKHYNDALNEFNTVLKQNPSNVSAQIGKADTLARAGRIPEAYNIYQTVLKAEPQNRRAQLGLAEAYVYGKNYDQAIRLYDQLILAEPENASYKVARARTLGYAGRYAQAVASLRPVIASHPNDTEARLAMAEAMTNSGERSLQNQAIGQYQTVLRAVPDNTDAHLGLGRAYSYTGHYPQAIDEFHGILKTQPKNEAALFALAEAQRFAGHPFDAKGTYAQTLQVDPNNVQAQAGMRAVRHDTAPMLSAYGRRYTDSNGVRLTTFGFGPTIPTRAGTIGLTDETGHFSQNGTTLSRKALNLLLARNFGPTQARLLVNRVRYNGAPSRNLYDLLVQRAPNTRDRVYLNVAKHEIIESLGAVTRGITATQYGAGIDHPLAERIDLTASLAHLKYSDDNTRNTLGASLLYRLQANAPTLRLGLGYSHDDTKFISPLYYTPQNFNVIAALADYVYSRDRLRLGVFASVPLTNRSGSGGVYNNRAADTLFGYLNYDLSDLIELYLQGGIVHASNFHSNDITGGVNLRF